MATIKIGAYGTAVTVLATELNSLANSNVSGVSGSGTGTIFDNTTNLNLFGDAELVVTFGAAPTAGASIELHAYESVDGGTTYETSLASGATLPNDQPVGIFIVEGTGTAQRLHIRRLPLSPGKTKFALVNSAGQAFPASGSTVTITPYSLTSA